MCFQVVIQIGELMQRIVRRVNGPASLQPQELRLQPVLSNDVAHDSGHLRCFPDQLIDKRCTGTNEACMRPMALTSDTQAVSDPPKFPIVISTDRSSNCCARTLKIVPSPVASCSCSTGYAPNATRPQHSVRPMIS